MDNNTSGEWQLVTRLVQVHTQMPGILSMEHHRRLHRPHAPQHMALG